MLLLGQATPTGAVWLLSTDPFVAVTVEPPLAAAGLQQMKAFVWVPAGQPQPALEVVRELVALYARDVEHCEPPTTLSVIQGSPDPAHTPPAWLVCDSPHGAEPKWHGLVHLSDRPALVAAGRVPRSPDHWHFDFPSFQRPEDEALRAGLAVFDAYHEQLAALPPPP